jgi:translation elongation factor P/translation initiation factor 5A
MLRLASRAARAAAAAGTRRDPRVVASAAAPWDPLAALGAWLRQQRGVKTQSNEARAGVSRAGRSRFASAAPSEPDALPPAPQLRGGQVIERDGRLLVVVEAKHTQGQGRASGFVQLQARDVRSGTKYVERLSPSDMVERVTLDRVDYTYLYHEGKNVVLMHPTTFEQVRRSRRAALTAKALRMLAPLLRRCSPRASRARSSSCRSRCSATPGRS